MRNTDTNSQIGSRAAADQRDKPYPLLWIILGVLSPYLSVPAMERIVQNTGLLGHSATLAVALVFGLLVALAIKPIAGVERRSYKTGLAVLWGVSLVLLWYWSV